MEKYFNELKAFLYGVVIYLQIDKEIGMVLIFLIFGDMLFGSIKAAVLPNLEFKINIFWIGLLKKSLLLIIIMTLALVAKGLGFTDFKKMVTVVMKIMVLNEGISIISAVRSIWTKQDLKSSDFISILINKIEENLKKYMDKLIKLFD